MTEDTSYIRTHTTRQSVVKRRNQFRTSRCFIRGEIYEWRDRAIVNLTTAAVDQTRMVGARRCRIWYRIASSTRFLR